MAEPQPYFGEVLYAARINKHGSLQLAKFDADRSGPPLDVYTITAAGRGACDCAASYRMTHKGGCKHKKLVQEWLNFGVPFEGGFYNYDTKTLYTPLDGEGIPLGPFVPPSWA